MFCPNCGEKTNFEQVYCRSCGAGLSETSHKLSKYYADIEGKVDWFKRVGLFSFGVINSFALVFIVVIVLNSLQMSGDRGLPFLLILLMSLTAILAGSVSVLYFEKKQSKKIKKELSKNKDFAPASFKTQSTSKELNESSYQPIGSVTDHTTELFTAKIPRTRTSGELG